MSRFEFFMGFYGLLLGLSVAELTSGFGNLLRARTRPRWGVATPVAGAVVLMMIVTAFSDAWLSLQQVTIDLRGLLPPTGIALSLYLSAMMVVPREAGEWQDLDSYFLARRKIILLPLIANIALVIMALEVPHMIQRHQPPSAAYLVINATNVGLILLAAMTGRLRVAAGALVLFLGLLLFIYFSGGTISDLFARLIGG